MMGFSIQFRGVENVALLAALGGAISAVVLGYGVWQFLRHRRRRGVTVILSGIAAGVFVTVAAWGVSLDSPAGRTLWLVLLGAVIILAVGVFYSAVYAYLGRRRMIALLGLRFGAIMALLLVLFKPVISVHPSPGESKPLLPILVDRSASMATADKANLPDRYRQAVEALASQEQRLVEHFRVAWIHFASDYREVEDIEELSGMSPSGDRTDATDIASAVRRAGANYSSDELAGVILISDGLHNASGDAVVSAAESPVPVFCLGVGSRDEKASGQRNVRLLTASAPLEAIKNNVTTVAATLKLTGWANIPSRIILTEDGKEVSDRQVLTESNSETMTVKLKWTPGEPASGGADIRKLKIIVEPNRAETTDDDNAAELHVLVTSPRIRVLYVEGTMRPEYKYLRRMLAGDPNVESVCMVRFAGNRFLSQGSIDGERLSSLPTTDEDFAMFDVIILSDLDRTFMSRNQMERIRRFVNDGKALLMLGGRNSFGPGGFGGTPIETALPVFCGSRRQSQESTRFIPQLTTAGAESPVFADIGEYFHTPDGRAGKDIPKLLGCVTVPRAKPAANVLAIHPTRRNANGPLIVLAVQQFGAGRSAAFTADTTWQWYLRLRPMGAESPYHRFWGQLIRYLAGADKTSRTGGASVLVRINKAYIREGEELKITTQVKGDDAQPVSNASVTAVLRAEGEQKDTLQAALIPSEGAGIYSASVRPGGGKYIVTITARDKNAEIIGTDSLPLIVATHSKEMGRLARDDATLQAIAKARDGRYVELTGLPDVVDELIRRRAASMPPAPPEKHYSLYNFPLLFLIFVALLTTEWILRRNWQLR